MKSKNWVPINNTQSICRETIFNFRISIIILFFLLSFLIIGCAGKRKKLPHTPSITKTQIGEITPDILKYYIQPGDEVNVKYFYNPELNEETTVRLDGKISLQLIGDVMLAGLTPMEAGTDIKERYSKLYQEALNSKYRLRSGDIIDIKFFYNPELNETLKIRTDGMVSLALIDDVLAQGKTTVELSSEIKTRYGSTLQKGEATVILRESRGAIIYPEITVMLKSHKEQPIYIGGEVNDPGLITLNSIITVADAVIMAGGLKDTAGASNVIVITRNEDRTVKIKEVDLFKVFEGADGVENPILRPYDIVYVPKSFIAEANIFVDQYIRKLIPVNLNFGYYYRIFD